MRPSFVLFFLAVAGPALAQQSSFQVSPARPEPDIRELRAALDRKEINCTELNDSTAVCDCDHEPSARHAAACRIVLDANCSYHPNDDVWTCPIDP